MTFRCTAVALLVSLAMAGSAITNPVLVPTNRKFVPRDYLHRSCDASFRYKLKATITAEDSEQFANAATAAQRCAIVYRVHCREWYAASSEDPLVARATCAACEAIYKNLYDAISLNGTSVNPFDALVHMGGWHAARDGWLKNSQNNLSPFRVRADIMAVAVGKHKHIWDATGFNEAAQLKMVKSVIMGMIGDDRTATMMRLVSDCAVEVLKTTGIKHPHAATVRKYFSVDAIGSCLPTSDFDITIKALEHKDAKRRRLTPHVVQCVNTAFIERVAPALNRDAKYGMLFSAASFYDSNVYSEDEIPAEVSRDAPLTVPEGILRGIQVREMEREEGRVGMSKAADQVVWALLDPGALSMRPAGEQLIPSVPDVTLLPDSLRYLPFGVAEALLSAASPALTARASNFADFVMRLRNRADKCMAVASAAEDPLKSALAAALTKTGFGAKLGAGRITDAEYAVLARNIAYTELSKLADALGSYKDELSAEGNPNAQALRAAVGGYYNLRSLSMQYASEAGRTAGLLWHVLPVLQMKHDALQPGTRLMLPAYVENFQNAMHKTHHLLLPGGHPEHTVKCTLERKKLINDVLAAGGKYLFRYTDAFVRMDGGLRSAVHLPPGSMACAELEPNMHGGDAAVTGAGRHHFRSDRGSGQQALAASDNAATAVVAEGNHEHNSAAVSSKAVSLGNSARAMLEALDAALGRTTVQFKSHAFDMALSRADADMTAGADSAAASAVHTRVSLHGASASDYTKAHIVPTNEEDLLYYLCGRTIAQANTADSAPLTGFQSCIARRAHDTGPELKGDKVLAAYYAAAGSSRATVMTALTQMEDRVGGINKAYARLGRVFEDMRKLDNDEAVARMLDVTDPSKPSLAFSLKDDAPLWTQLRDAGRLTVAGALSRLLGEAQCWTGDGEIKASCKPSITEAECKFSIVHLGDAKIAKSLNARAAKEPGMAALLRVVDSTGQLDWAKLRTHIAAQVSLHLPAL